MGRVYGLGLSLVLSLMNSLMRWGSTDGSSLYKHSMRNTVNVWFGHWVARARDARGTRMTENYDWHTQKHIRPPTG